MGIQTATKASTNASAERTGQRSQAHASLDVPSGSYADVLALQRSAGNRSVTQVVEAEGGNRPGDIYEQEADRITDQVMAAPSHNTFSGALPRIQRFSGQSPGQMDATPASVGPALASPGSPLEPALRQEMEQRFGYDFSNVRVHSGAAAEQSAQDVNAHAYTMGHDIVFGAGRFAPGTHAGRRLLAHELTHVVHQTGRGIPSIQRQEKKGQPNWETVTQIAAEENFTGLVRAITSHGRTIRINIQVNKLSVGQHTYASGQKEAPSEDTALRVSVGSGSTPLFVYMLPAGVTVAQEVTYIIKPASREQQARKAAAFVERRAEEKRLKESKEREAEEARRKAAEERQEKFREKIEHLTPDALRAEAAEVVGALGAPTLSNTERQVLESNLQALEDYASAQGFDLPAATAYRLGQVITALASDLGRLGSELKKTLRTEVGMKEVGEEGPNPSVFQPEAVWALEKLSWAVDALSEARDLTATAEAGGAQSTQQFRAAGTRVTAVLLTSQAVAIHLAYLHVGVVAASDLGAEQTIASKVRMVREQLQPKLLQLELSLLDPRDPSVFERAVRELQRPWDNFQADFNTFVEEIEESFHTRKRIIQVLNIISLFFAARGLMTPRGGGPPIAGGPGISGVTAGGVAVARGAVGSVEWLAALRRLAAIGAISTAGAFGRIGHLPMPAKPTLTAASQGKPPGDTGASPGPTPQPAPPSRADPVPEPRGLVEPSGGPPRPVGPTAEGVIGNVRPQPAPAPRPAPPQQPAPPPRRRVNENVLPREGPVPPPRPAPAPQPTPPQAGTRPGRIVAGYRVKDAAERIGDTYRITIEHWVGREPGLNPEGLRPFLNALRGEAAAAGASRIEIIAELVGNPDLTRIFLGPRGAAAARLYGFVLEPLSSISFRLSGAVR